MQADAFDFDRMLNCELMEHLLLGSKSQHSAGRPQPIIALYLLQLGSKKGNCGKSVWQRYNTLPADDVA
jgi:hypothetical protein